MLIDELVVLECLTGVLNTDGVVLVPLITGEQLLLLILIGQVNLRQLSG